MSVPKNKSLYKKEKKIAPQNILSYGHIFLIYTRAYLPPRMKAYVGTQIQYLREVLTLCKNSFA